jgi:hypothetical protein
MQHADVGARLLGKCVCKRMDALEDMTVLELWITNLVHFLFGLKLYMWTILVEANTSFLQPFTKIHQLDHQLFQTRNVFPRL